MPKVPFVVNDIEVDGTTLTVDEVNNRVGVGTDNPGVTLDVVGVIKASDGVITLTTAGTPSTSIADGALAVDTTNDKLFIRSGSAWVEASGGGGGSSTTSSDTPPSSPTNGEMWFESDTGNLYLYYDSQWIAVGGSTVLASQIPAGTVTMYGGGAAPTGWLVCDGTAVSRSTYSDLFDAIGTRYGSGDGSTTFNLPLSSSRTVRGITAGANIGANAIAANGNASISTNSDSHSHSISATNSSDSHSHTITSNSGSGGASHSHSYSKSNGSNTAANTGAATANHSHTITSNAGSDSHTHTITVSNDSDSHSHSGTGTISGSVSATEFLFIIKT